MASISAADRAFTWGAGTWACAKARRQERTKNAVTRRCLNLVTRGLLRFIGCCYRPFCLEIRLPGSPGEGDDVPDIRHARHVEQQTFESQAET